MGRLDLSLVFIVVAVVLEFMLGIFVIVLSSVTAILGLLDTAEDCIVNNLVGEDVSASDVTELGLFVSAIVGAVVVSTVVFIDVTTVGLRVGSPIAVVAVVDGLKVGCWEGVPTGLAVSDRVNIIVGSYVGLDVFSLDGMTLGIKVFAAAGMDEGGCTLSSVGSC